MKCYRPHGCGPYEMLPCNECPASKPEYLKGAKEKMNTRTRLNGTDSVMDVAMKMSDGNPGALNVIMQFLKNPMDIVFLLACDSIGLYGSQLYMLWNDCCGRDMDKVKRVLTGWQRGKITAEEIMQHVSGGWGTPFEGLDDED